MRATLAPSRRTVVIGGMAAGLAVATAGVDAGAAQSPTRPDIDSATGQKMTDLYAAAVKAMQDPEINYPPRPQSWTFQAYIHGVPSNPFDPANSGGLYTGTAGLKKRVDEIYGDPPTGSPAAEWKAAALACWGSCTHASPYFTTWHRWYVYYFERICREMCKDPAFMLPYWNYASDIGPSLQLPAKFRGPAPALLFDDRGLGFANPQGSGPQNVAMNNGGYMPYPLIDYGPALDAKVMFPSDTAFFAPPSPGYSQLGFTGRLECVPHDMVHDNVGGWMGNVPSAAGDPIFYVHHCQVDRLYASWEAESGVSYNWGNTPTQPDEHTWKSREAAFVDEKGKLVKVKLGNAINTQALGYDYDNLANPPPPEVAALMVAAAAQPSNRVMLAAMRSAPFSVPGGGASITLTPEHPQPGAATPRAASAGAPTTLVLEGIRLVHRPPAPLSVFVNLPKGVAPELNGPYYVGTLSLFNFDAGTGRLMTHTEEAGHADHAAAQPRSEARFDVGSILQRQRARGLWNDGSITVTITTVGADTHGDLTYVTFESAVLEP